MRRRLFLEGLGGAAGALMLRSGTADAAALAPIVSTQASQTPNWSLIRSQFRLPRDTAYLNTAGLGASPVVVIDTVKARMDREEENPAPGHNEDDWRRIRGKCAALLGSECRGQDIAFLSTATEGINAILNTVPLGQGDEIVTSTHEHAGLVIPLLHKMRTTGCVVRTFEPDLVRARGNTDRIAAVTTARTRLIFISHVTCTTGQLMPVAEIGRFARDRGITFALDGAQSLGHVPFDVSRTFADYYAASGHKWVMGPKRTGLLYVHPDRQAAAVPTVVGAYSDESSNLFARTLTLRPNAQRFEYGTQNNALIYGLEAAVDYVSGLGMEALWQRNRALAERCRAGLQGLKDVEILSPADADSRTAILTFRVGGRDNGSVASSLMGQRLRARSVKEGGLDAVRASFHACNDETHVDRLIAAVSNLR
ncbi:MAG: aminotransferase class V-fold PLP-dependent enzyme [Acidobacteria bacterium]|nr:aminotransferase class V-fold PLP-dependent enzyme [Acidobacteriota bacterium]